MTTSDRAHINQAAPFPTLPSWPVGAAVRPAGVARAAGVVVREATPDQPEALLLLSSGEMLAMVPALTSGKVLGDTGLRYQFHTISDLGLDAFDGRFTDALARVQRLALRPETGRHVWRPVVAPVSWFGALRWWVHRMLSGAHG